MIKNLFFCLTLGILLCLSGCKIYTDYDLQEAYSGGYFEGYSDAQTEYEENWYSEYDVDDIRREAYNAGHASAEEYYAEGYHDAEFDHEEDWGNGYVDGFYDGYDIGYDDAKGQQQKDPSAYY